MISFTFQYFCNKDTEFTRDTPFLATADAPLVLIKGWSIDQANTQMMSVRWRFFHFWKQIHEKDQVCLAPCPRCFAKLIIDIKWNGHIFSYLPYLR